MASSNCHETDDFTTCVICFEKYDNGEHLPKYLLCLHTFCISCLSRMLLDSFTMTICCPTCRALTSPGNSPVVSLRTNEHALRARELEESIQKMKSQDKSRLEWCHTCNEIASPDCAIRLHCITSLNENNFDRSLTKNQLLRIKLQLHYALARRQEVETYLKFTQQSLSILDSHVTQLKNDNAAHIRQLEDALDNWSPCSTRTDRTVNAAKALETIADDEYNSAISFARTFEGARDLFVSVSYERADGKEALLLPNNHQMRLSLTNLVDDHAVNAAGMNTLAFILLLQLQQRHLNLMHLDLVQQSQFPSMSGGSNSTSVLESIFPLLHSRQSCFLDVELNFETRGRLVFELNSECPLELRNAFLNSFSHHRINHLNSSLVKAGVSLFVAFGPPLTSRNQVTDTHHQSNGPQIRLRGDVGIYHNGNMNPPDIVVLLAPYSERNVRRAPLVARIVDGIEVCHLLSRLKVYERPYCRVVNCGVH